MISAARVAPAAVAAAAMIATPLRRRGRRAGLASVVVSGLAVSSLGAATRRWGPARSVGALAVTAAGTLAVERVGTTTGIPFGRYAYTGILRPTVGDVPAVVPLAWFAMAVPARETAHGALGGRSSPLRRIVLGAALLSAWDLFLDPQMVGEGYWRWARPGRYRGIPLGNYLGWFCTGLAVMAVLERLLPPERDRADADLVGQYGFVTGMSSLGFAAFFGDRVVAAVGGAASLPAAGLALWRLRRGGPGGPGGRGAREGRGGRG